MGVPYLFDSGINLLAILFSAAIGVIFGYFPAAPGGGPEPHRRPAVRVRRDRSGTR